MALRTETLLILGVSSGRPSVGAGRQYEAYPCSWGPLAVRNIGRDGVGGGSRSNRRTYGARCTFGVDRPKTEIQISEESASLSSGKQSLGLSNI